MKTITAQLQRDLIIFGALGYEIIDDWEIPLRKIISREAMDTYEEMLESILPKSDEDRLLMVLELYHDTARRIGIDTIREGE